MPRGPLLTSWRLAGRTDLGAWLRREGRRDDLVAVVVRQGLLLVEAERIEDGPVLDREQDGVVGRRDVGVLMKSPRRQHEDVALAPCESAAVDDRLARAL